MCAMHYFLSEQNAKCGGNICSWTEGRALNLDTNPVDSKQLRSPGQPGWVSGMCSLSERMLSFLTSGHKPTHNYLGLENLPCGQTTPLQPITLPLKRLWKTVSRGLARWTARLIWCDSFTALFQAGSSGERWCWLQITGASTEPSHSALCRPCPCQPTCQVSFWGRSFSVYTKILPVTNFSECSRANKLRKQNTSNDSEDEGKTLFLWPKSQACRFPWWLISCSLSFSLWCRFPQPFPVFPISG